MAPASPLAPAVRARGEREGLSVQIGGSQGAHTHMHLHLHLHLSGKCYRWARLGTHRIPDEVRHFSRRAVTEASTVQ